MVQNILIELERQSTSHPDSSLKEFYKVLAVLAGNHSHVQKYLNTVVQKRDNIESSHLVNLIYRSIQYTLIYEHQKKDMGEYTYEVWETTVKDLFEKEETYNVILDKTLTESTQTNIYQRYTGPKAVTSKKYADNPVSVVDLGCSQNLGLMGMELNHPFAPVIDHTDSNELTTLINNKINIDTAVGIDTEDPEEKFKWALACRFYPKELHLFDNEHEMIQNFKSNSKKVGFIQDSILQLSDIWGQKNLPKVDVVIASLILYQLPAKLKEKAIKEVYKILKDDGILIINDFVKLNSHIKWNIPWFENGQSNYRTVVLKKGKHKFLQPLEYIVWSNGRCKEACPGKDFHNI